MGENPGPARPIRVLLADDHMTFRQALAGVLASYGSIEVVAQANNDEGALELARQELPDVMIMQVQLPFERAKDLLERLRMISPSPRVVIVTMFEEPRFIRELMRLGTSAYLVKSSSVEHLIGAVRAAVFDPLGKHVVVGMLPGMLENSPDGSEGTLSTRELEILLLASRDLSNRQIATKIHLAQATVKRHLTNTYSKMGVASRAEAARRALSEGWITIQDVTEEQDSAPEGD
jgi:DNA-binding NarL/FixJ family response regulator